MEDEDHMEDLQEVKTSLAEFLLVLLASPKHGVLFHDPELGCEKSANPLITEVPVPYMFLFNLRLIVSPQHLVLNCNIPETQPMIPVHHMVAHALTVRSVILGYYIFKLFSCEVQIFQRVNSSRVADPCSFIWICIEFSLLIWILKSSKFYRY